MRRCAGRVRDGEGGSARHEPARRRSPERAARRERRGREGGRGSGNIVMKGTSGERERVEPRALSLDPAGSNPSRPSSPSHGRPRRKGSGAARRTLRCRPEESARSCRRRIDEPVAPALDVGNPVEATGAGRTKEHGAMAARVGDHSSRSKLRPSEKESGSSKTITWPARGFGLAALARRAAAFARQRARHCCAVERSVGVSRSRIATGQSHSYGPIDSSISL